MPKVWVSNGELVDKWTILEIKFENLSSSVQRSRVQIELDLLFQTVNELQEKFHLGDLINRLRNTNKDIWNLMDQIYEIKEPTLKYAELSMEITFQNQQRAFVKREIDNVTHSETSEEKSYFLDSGQLILKGDS